MGRDLYSALKMCHATQKNETKAATGLPGAEYIYYIFEKFSTYLDYKNSENFQQTEGDF